jgi:hypothetical protein
MLAARSALAGFLCMPDETTTTATEATNPATAPAADEAKPVDEQELAKKVADELNEAQESRKPAEEHAYLDYAFYKGEHYATYEQTTRTILKNDDKNDPRVVVNFVKDKVERQLGFATDARPTINVVAQSADEKKRQHAEIANRRFQYLWEELGMEEKLNRWILHALIFPVSYLKPYWDTEAENGIGEIAVDNLSFFAGYFAPQATNMHDAPHFFCAVPRKVSYIKSKYGKEVSAADKLVFTDPEDRIVQTEMNKSAADLGDGYALVVEKWSKEKIVTIAGDKVLRNEKNAYEHGGIPVIDLRYTDLLRAYGQSYITQFRRPQQAYNKILRRILEHIDKNAVVRYFKPKDTKVNKALTNKESEIYEYEGTQPPTAISPAPLTGEVFQQLKDLENTMDKLAGHSDISGRVLGSGVSGDALNAYQEMSSVKVRLFVRKVEIAMRRLGRMMLSLMRQYYTEKRTFAVFADGTMQEYTLEPGMLDGLDVSITIGSALPEGKAARKDFVMQLYDKRIIGQTEVRKLLDLEGVIPEPERAIIAPPATPPTNGAMPPQPNAPANVPPELLASLPQQSS